MTDVPQEPGIRQEAGVPLATDLWIYRIVVIVLGIVVLSAAGGAIMLTLYEYSIPDLLTALGSAAVGALAGLLSPLGAPNRR